MSGGNWQNVICEDCRDLGEQSQVSILNKDEIAHCYMPTVYTEDGRAHYHGPNQILVRFHCSRGHRWNDMMAFDKCWCHKG